MNQRSLTIITCAALLLAAPLLQAADSPAITAPAEATTIPLLAGPHGKADHPRCRHHAKEKAASKAGKSCHHGKRSLVLEQLERIEQRQILIETMLRQLLARNGS